MKRIYNVSVSRIKMGSVLCVKGTEGKIRHMPITLYIERLMTQAKFNVDDYK